MGDWQRFTYCMGDLLRFFLLFVLFYHMQRQNAMINVVFPSCCRTAILHTTFPLTGKTQFLFLKKRKLMGLAVCTRVNCVGMAGLQFRTHAFILRLILCAVILIQVHVHGQMARLQL